MKRTLAITAFSLLAAAQLRPQVDTPREIKSRSVSVDWTTVALEDAGDKLQLVLPDPATQRWVLGIEVKPNGKDRLDISEARLGTLAITRIRRVEQVSAYDRSKVTTSRGAIFVESSQNGSVLVICVQMARPRIVDISGGNMTPTRLRVEDSVLLVDGSSTGRGFNGRHELVMVAGFGTGGARGLTASAPTRSQQGTYVVGPDLLRSHLVRYVDFDGVAAHAGVRSLIVRIDIGSDGAVKDVRCRGDESSDVTATVVTTIRQWTFRPFEVNGRAESVQAQIPVLITPDGHVASEFSPAAVVR